MFFFFKHKFLSNIFDTTYITGDYCDPNPCFNGGTCTSGDTGFTCTCLPEFSGARCDMRPG